MYARSYSDPDENKTFRRGEYNIPANYRGNAFTADEIPVIESVGDIQKSSDTSEHVHPDADVREVHEAEKAVNEPPCEVPKREESRGGLLRGLFSKFERGFEFDDLLLIGLILLLLKTDKDECDENSDEMILLLLFLLLGGF